MAIYDYICSVCQHHFEVQKPMAEYAQPEACPVCYAPAGRAYIGFPAVILGQGFFKPMDWGKRDKDVCYPDGKIKRKSYNELYEDGLLGATV